MIISFNRLKSLLIKSSISVFCAKTLEKSRVTNKYKINRKLLIQQNKIKCTVRNRYILQCGILHKERWQLLRWGVVFQDQDSESLVTAVFLIN